MKNKEDIERECRQRVVQYLEALTKHRELVSQFVSCGWVESGKPIPSPKRVLDIAAYKQIRESEQEVEDARKKWNEALGRLLKDCH